MTDPHLKKKQLIFIPDISGYSKFVNETEIEHSQHIISELLELIIDSDNLSMTVSEIEGDAVLFYLNHVPDATELLNQCTTTFVNFHNHLKRYDTERICRCGACVSASSLSLKFIVHAGELETIKVGTHEKIHGRDVVLAHKLLKNSVKLDEYVLFSQDMDTGTANEDLANAIEGSDHYDSFGDVKYSYIGLSALHKRVSPSKPITFPKLSQEKITLELNIASSLDKVYESFTNFDIRLRWSKSIQNIINHGEKLGKSGSLHTCLVGSYALDIEAIGRNEDHSKLVYGERLNKFRILRDVISYYTLEENAGHVHISVEIDFKIKSIIGKAIKPFVKGMLEKQTLKGLHELKTYCEKN